MAKHLKYFCRKFIYRLNVNNTDLLFLNYLAKGQIIQKAFKLKAPERCFKFKILMAKHLKYFYRNFFYLIDFKLKSPFGRFKFKIFLNYLAFG